MGIQVYAQDTGISFSPPYNVAATALLRESVIDTVSTATNSGQVVKILGGFTVRTELDV